MCRCSQKHDSQQADANMSQHGNAITAGCEAVHHCIVSVWTLFVQ